MDTFADLLNLTSNNVPPQKGKVLISQPFMADGCFHRSVVLLVEYSRDGAVGFVLNKPLKINLDDLTDDFEASAPLHLSVGGPVATDTLHFLHTFEHIPDASEIVRGIYWGGNPDTVRRLLSLSILKPADIRFFIGYSGWTAGQLDDELKRNSWLVSNIRPSQIIHPQRNLWRESVQAMGAPYQIWTTFPENPTYN